MSVSFVNKLKSDSDRMRYRASRRIHFSGLLSLSFILFIFCACNPTKHIGEKQYLLNKNVIVSNKPEFNEDLYVLIKQKPNRRIIGLFRFHLGIYNLFYSSNVETSKHWYVRAVRNSKKWIKTTIGEEPVLLDSLATRKSVNQLNIYLHNKGYFNASVKDTVHFKRKKAKVIYTIKTGTPYTIRNISRESKDTLINIFLQSEKNQSLLKSGENYDVEVLQKERDRFTKELKNKGYYFFNKEYIYYKIDSSLNSQQVDITLGVRVLNENSKTQKEEYHHAFKINAVYIQPDFNPRNLDNQPKDTLIFKNNYFVSFSKELQYKPDILLQKIFIRQDEYFKSDNLDKTYRGLSDLGVFKFTNIRFEEVKDTTAYRLNCFIQLSPSAKESFTIETEGTYNDPNLGVAGNITFRNKNTFKGAELFEFKLRGALEAQKSPNNDQTNDQVFNTLRVGPEASLNFQKFLLPFKLPKRWEYMNPRTSIPVSYNYERRPGYDRSSTNISLSYNWRSSVNSSYSITPVEINKVNVDKLPEFELKLKELNDPFITSSYQTHLTTISRFTYFYNNQDITVKKDFMYFRFNMEFSGNILRKINILLDSPIENNSYKVFGVNYSQFLRPEFDVRFYKVYNPYNTLVYRIYSGIGYAYQNATSLPVEKLFFAGGASDIRGWAARTLGPGSYKAPANSIDQNGDFKIETNLEYRFYILKILEGAAFIDAGNIWGLNNSSRPGSRLNEKTFLDEIAIATGLGARFNFSFFIFRVDGGIKVKDPSKDIDNRYVLKNTKIKDINWNIGIGYPF